MVNKVFLLSLFLFLVILTVDGLIFVNGLTALGLFSFLGSLLVFASGMIWLVYKNDKSLHFKRSWRLLPILVFGAGAFLTLRGLPMEYKASPESLDEVGNLFMARYQAGFWVTSLLIFFVFLIACNLLERSKA